MQGTFNIEISRVADLLMLERSPKAQRGAVSFNAKCPFCCGRGYKLNVNAAKNCFHCVRCDTSGGTLELYSMVRYGQTAKGKGKELYYELATELEQGGSGTKPSAGLVPAEVYRDIEPVSDRSLNLTYRYLLALPYLKLSSAHRENLIRRGMTEQRIRQSLYRSLRSPKEWIAQHPGYELAAEWYSGQAEPELRNGLSQDAQLLSGIPEGNLIAGALIAADLSDAGIPMDGVPGFFTFAGRWVFRYDCGMLIPAVSLDGNIVGMQIRRDVKTANGLRYMTVSGKGFSGGVTTRIARTHIAQTEAGISEYTSVLVTEGPLKADVIAHLLAERGIRDVAVIGIQGVCNTRELPEIAEELKARGISRIRLALDMDKTGNLEVAKAGRNIKAIFEKHGMETVSLCWDREYAGQKHLELSVLAEEHGLKLPEDRPSIYENLYHLAELLTANGIEYNARYLNGEKRKVHWRDETKGLDDYLCHCMHR